MRKKEKNIELTPIEYPCFDAFIHYFVERDKKKAAEYVREKYDKKYDEILGNGLTICDQRDPVVWLASRKPSIVAHEMVHAVKAIFGNLGHFKITDDNDELFAYMVDYAVKSVLEDERKA